MLVYILPSIKNVSVWKPTLRKRRICSLSPSDMFAGITGIFIRIFLFSFRVWFSGRFLKRVKVTSRLILKLSDIVICFLPCWGQHHKYHDPVPVIVVVIPLLRANTFIFVYCWRTDCGHGSLEMIKSPVCPILWLESPKQTSCN